MGHGRELVESFLILGIWVGIMNSDLFEIAEENFFPVDIFVGGEGDSMLFFPTFKLVDLAGWL